MVRGLFLETGSRANESSHCAQLLYGIEYMVNRNLIRTLDLSEEEWQQELNEALESAPPEDLEWKTQEVAVNQIVPGRVLRIENDVILVDVGYKSEGIVFRNEWDEDEELPKPGDMIQVLIEDVEDINGLVDDARGMITLSKRKAEKIQAWKSVMDAVHEGDVVTGVATRKIKGGLLVDIGVPVFLPASQVDIRRPADIGDYLNRTIQSLVLKIDDARRNIVVSRRALIESERAEKKAQLFAELEVGQRAGHRREHCRLRRVRQPSAGIDGLLITIITGHATGAALTIPPRWPDRRPGNRSPDPGTSTTRKRG